jgi:carboxymethylenebutenolidase
MATERQESIPLTSGGAMRGYLALPDGEAPEGGWPAVIAIHDIFGLSADIRRIARRFASAGYAALAPALYDGAGAPFLCVVRTLRDMRRHEGPAFDRLEAARSFIQASPDLDGTRIAVTGFCLGGGFAIFFAARGGVQVAAPYYGETPAQADELRDVCPVVAGFGELDAPFVGHGHRLAEHLEALGVAHDVKIYPEVGHSYMNDHGGGAALTALMKRTPMHAAYDEQASEDSWRRMLAFFAEHL